MSSSSSLCLRTPGSVPAGRGHHWSLVLRPGTAPGSALAVIRVEHARDVDATGPAERRRRGRLEVDRDTGSDVLDRCDSGPEWLAGIFGLHPVEDRPHGPAAAGTEGHAGRRRV